MTISNHLQMNSRLPHTLGTVGNVPMNATPPDYGTRDISSRFGRRLRELRKQRGWTQIQMADFLGIDRSYISDLERGKKSAGLGTLEVIALGFNVSLSSLLKDI